MEIDQRIFLGKQHYPLIPLPDDEQGAIQKYGARPVQLTALAGRRTRVHKGLSPCAFPGHGPFRRVCGFTYANAVGTGPRQSAFGLQSSLQEAGHPAASARRSVPGLPWHLGGPGRFASGSGHDGLAFGAWLSLI